MALLEVKGLQVEYRARGKWIPAVRGVSFSVQAGESLGIVGESGSGKSTVALALLGLIGAHEGRTAGEILWEGKRVDRLQPEELRFLRGKEIGIIFQDPFTSLNPVLKVGEQVAEAVGAHHPRTSGAETRVRALELLRQVQLQDCERIALSYPHQISGGQRQRAMIAMAIANRPKLLIADEPTTALDVTVQKGILDLLARLKTDLGMALILVTHHFGIVSNYTERLIVMRAGEFVEEGGTRAVLQRPRHAYTQSLLDCLPERIAARPQP